MGFALALPARELASEQYGLLTEALPIYADAGVPTCAVFGHPDWEPARPSEGHLPIDLPPGVEAPEIGAQIYLPPRHICPTVNNFDAAALVSGGRVVRLEAVTACGHEPGTL